ncbi:MBL fold metallo-hydrolase [Methanococcus vannielii]|nr:MBL fold metallo-hydrolase [Methanococcus vannielii]
MLYNGSIIYIDEKNEIWASPCSSSTYVETKKHKIVIDTSKKEKMKVIISNLNKLDVRLKDIDYVINTHNHISHTENNDIFKNADILKYSDGSLDNFNDSEIEVLLTPGHTFDSISLIYDDYVIAPAAVNSKRNIIDEKIVISAIDDELARKSILKIKSLKKHIVTAHEGILYNYEYIKP